MKMNKTIRSQPVLFFVLALTVTVSFVVASPRAHAIAGGWWVKGYQDAPFMVEVTPVGCAGTVIASKWVLTAAHCIKGKVENQVHIINGGSDRLGGDEHYWVDKTFIHPSFNYNSIYRNYDIALIKLATEIDFKNSKIKPIRLADSAFAEKEMKAGVMLNLYGWGATGDSKQDQIQTPYLKSAQAPLQSLEHVIKIGPNAYGHMAGGTMFAVGFDKGGVGACGGDSGGPVTVTLPDGEQVELGVMSWGYSCERPYGYSIYNRVSDALGWILKTMNEK